MSGLTLSPTLYRDLIRSIEKPTYEDRNLWSTGGKSLFYGVDVHENSVFPYTTACNSCASTGDGGSEATYCQACHGGGKITNVGVMMNGPQTIVIVEYHKPLFEPRWAASVAVPRRCIESLPDHQMRGSFQ